MSSLSSMTALFSVHGRGSLPPAAPVRPTATGIAAAQPLGAGKAPSPAPDDPALQAARGKIAAAVRSAFLHGMVRASAGLPADAGTAAVPQFAAVPRRNVFVGEIIARISVQAVRLPVLPEPATPARDAFAQAVVALRSGLRRTGDGGLAGSA